MAHGVRVQCRSRAETLYPVSCTLQLLRLRTLQATPLAVPCAVPQAELQRLMAGSGVTVGVHEAFLSFAMCDVCVNAFTKWVAV